MFRKFLKVLPKADGKSKLDWQNYWVERSRPLWSDEMKAFLDQPCSRRWSSLNQSKACCPLYIFRSQADRKV